MSPSRAADNTDPSRRADLRTVLIVSPYFPPSTLAGVHRARLLAKHLPSSGWWPVVVCVDEAYHEERLDPGLSNLVPDSTEIVKVPALSERWCRPLGLGDIGLRAWGSLRRGVLNLVGQRRIDAVLITGSPYYPMLLASEIKRHGVPVVLDFQDPWVSAWGAAQRRWTKAGLTHRLAMTLEPRAVGAADFITSVSEKQNAELLERYSWLDSSRMAAIPIGGDADDFAALRACDRTSTHLATDRVNFSYVGTIWPAVMATLTVLLKSVARLKELRPAAYARLRLNFIGTTAQPDNVTEYRVRPLADALGVGDVVYEVPQRLPYLEALAVTARTDVNLMIGSSEPHYTASKVFSVLLSGRPHVSLFHRASSAHAIAARAGGGLAYAFDSDGERAALTNSIAEGIGRLAAAPTLGQRIDPAACAPFEAQSIARQFASIFDRLAQETDASRAPRRKSARNSDDASQRVAGGPRLQRPASV